MRDTSTLGYGARVYGKDPIPAREVLARGKQTLAAVLFHAGSSFTQVHYLRPDDGYNPIREVLINLDQANGRT